LVLLVESDCVENTKVIFACREDSESKTRLISRVEPELLLPKYTPQPSAQTESRLYLEKSSNCAQNSPLRVDLKMDTKNTHSKENSKSVATLETIKSESEQSESHRPDTEPLLSKPLPVPQTASGLESEPTEPNPDSPTYIMYESNTNEPNSEAKPEVLKRKFEVFQEGNINQTDSVKEMKIDFIKAI